jgi:hypothetical protein
MRILKLVAALGMALAAAGASATILSYTFTANGVTDSVSQAGTAVFTFDTQNLGTFTVQLTDNVDPTSKIPSELDGFEFSFSGGPSVLSLTSVVAQSVINCNGSSGSSCPAGDGSSPYGWGVTLSGDDATLGAGFKNGGFSYHPYGIVNANYVAPGGNGGLSNAQHNPLLIGPVTFTFTVTGLQTIPEISNVTFLFGTVPDAQDGTCTSGANCPQHDPPTLPEPRMLALLGLALMSMAWVSRARLRRV